MTDPAHYLANLYSNLGSLDNDFRNSNLIQLVASEVTGDRVLDIGCGSGGLLRLLKAQGKAVCGLEPNSDLVELAGKLHPELHIVQGLGGDLDRVHGPFDCMTMIDVLEHIEDDVGQLQAMWDNLVPEGRLVIVVPSFPLLYGERDRNNGHFRRYTFRELKSKLEATGFEVLSHRFWNALGFFPYLISERVFGRELQVELRTNRPKNWLQRQSIRLLNLWFQSIERRFSIGFGLSLMCLAEKRAKADVLPLPSAFQRRQQEAQNRRAA